MKFRFPQDWRTQVRSRRRFYAKYMVWLERLGYAAVILVIGAFIFAFNYRVPDIIAADKVPIEATQTPIVATDATLIVRQIVPNFTRVEASSPILEVVTGERNIHLFMAWTAVLGQGVVIEKPTITTLSSPSSGYLVVTESQVGKPLEKEERLAEIRNYDDLRLKPSLSGQGVAGAKAGTQATIKSIQVEPDSSVRLRGFTPDGPLVSGALVAGDTVTQIENEIKDLEIAVRDDVPLQITGVSELAIDANLTLSSSTDAGIPADPPATATYFANVISGEHTALVQFASLPPASRHKVEEAIRNQLKGKVLLTKNGPRAIENVDSIGTVFKVKAKASTATHPDGLAGTAISRSFDAELKLEDPGDLKEVVLRAHRAGRTVTAKVELKTGDRPIALLLLKRS